MYELGKYWIPSQNKFEGCSDNKITLQLGFNE